jgi:hypothetical protein
VLIKGWKPKKKPTTPQNKHYNCCLLLMHVIVKNTIVKVKQWRILKGVYRHWWNGHGRIDVNHVLIVVVVLENRKIKQNPI